MQKPKQQFSTQIPVILFDFTGKTVLITGGTRGIGLACGLAFAKMGATCVLTYRWGPEDDNDVLAPFIANKTPPPILVQADVSEEKDTLSLMQQLAKQGLIVDVFISNATGSVSVSSLEDLTERALMSSIRYGVWPTIEYIQQMKRVLGRYPKYTVAISTTGIDSYTRNYDLVAASKASLEVLCRYVGFRLKDEDSRINIIRTRAIQTESLKAVVGDGLQQLAEKTNATGHLITAEEVANTVVALCSGLMDDMNGQTLNVDRGGLFSDNMSRLFTERENMDL
jgi:NAD(P)-dependent dehydrogenase (short-subunit alcohol dehydrogenase family)